LRFLVLPFLFAVGLSIKDYLYFHRHHRWKSKEETPDHTQFFRSFYEYKGFGKNTENYPYSWKVQKYRLLLFIVVFGFSFWLSAISHILI